MSGDPKIKLYILGRLGYENVADYNPISLAIGTYSWADSLQTHVLWSMGTSVYYALVVIDSMDMPTYRSKKKIARHSN